MTYQRKSTVNLKVDNKALPDGSKLVCVGFDGSRAAYSVAGGSPEDFDRMLEYVLKKRKGGDRVYLHVRSKANTTNNT